MRHHRKVWESEPQAEADGVPEQMAAWDFASSFWDSAPEAQLGIPRPTDVFAALKGNFLSVCCGSERAVPFWSEIVPCGPVSVLARFLPAFFAAAVGNSGKVQKTGQRFRRSR